MGPFAHSIPPAVPKNEVEADARLRIDLFETCTNGQLLEVALICERLRENDRIAADGLAAEAKEATLSPFSLQHILCSGR